MRDDRAEGSMTADEGDGRNADSHDPDEDKEWYADTLKGRIEHLEAEARRLGFWGLLAGIDQLRAGIADYRDTALREAGVIPDWEV